MKSNLIIRKPDDFHLHLRDDPGLQHTVLQSARHFARAVVMPNLNPPVTDLALVKGYRSRIEQALKLESKENTFTPLMMVYLTEDHTPEQIQELYESGEVFGFKLYPAGATTHSHAGIRDLEKAYTLFEKMEQLGAPLLIHGEVTDPEVDLFHREAVFIERHLDPLIRRFPELKVALEHLSSKEGVQFVQDGPQSLGATITPHHLAMDRNSIFRGGLQSHHYCLPILKTKEDREAIVKAAVSDHPRFFAGTDSAPHPISAKESAKAAAGIYNAPVAISIYASIFEQENRLDRLESFLSEKGASFYGISLNEGSIRLTKEPMEVPESLPFLGDSRQDRVQPLFSGSTLFWSVE